jgi:hypothetical protein
VVQYPRQILQMDLVDMIKFSRQNSHYKYIINLPPGTIVSNHPDLCDLGKVWLKQLLRKLALCDGLNLPHVTGRNQPITIGLDRLVISSQNLKM